MGKTSDIGSECQTPCIVVGMEHGTLLSVGERWPGAEGDLPEDALSFGWHLGNLLVIGDPHKEVNLPHYIQSRIRLGFAEFGPFAVLAFEAHGIPALLDCARPYLPGDPPPEVSIEPSQHMLWQVALVQAGVVTNLRAFMTSPAVTVLLRRVAAMQRAQGPIEMDEADGWLQRWYRAAPSEEMVWARCMVQCLAGD